MNSVVLNETNLVPSKVVCVGRNYVEHIQELNNEMPTEPVLFIKPNSAISNQLVSGTTEAIHYEAELCFLVKEGQLSAIGVGLDLTKREVQTHLKQKGLPWERAKAFNQSAVFGQFVDCTSPLNQYSMKLFINDQLIQYASYDLMIHKPQALLNEISSIFALEDNDIIMTGTPKGVGIVNQGDTFTTQLLLDDKVLIEASWIAKP